MLCNNMNETTVKLCIGNLLVSYWDLKTNTTDSAVHSENMKPGFYTKGCPLVKSNLICPSDKLS